MGYCNKHDAYNGNGTCIWCDREMIYGDSIAQLMVFYNVETKDDLIGAQEKHIKSLQEQLPKDNQRIETRVRG